MAHERSQTNRARQCETLAVAAPALVLLLALVPIAAAGAGIEEHPGGFWKCRPPTHLSGAFNNEDPVGLAARSHVATDCALHWSDGHGATYCFATPPSLLLFKDDPDTILRKAQAFWRLSHTQK